MARHIDLFGGSQPWDPEAWTSSDDRVRGGKSQSYLDCPSASLAAFHGNLDITALGGAGFASQRTVDPRSWDLNAYDGLLIRIGQSDGKKYTLNLKDDILPKRPDGREQSTVSWEYDFTSQGQEELRIPFGHFKPTYRGKDKPDATPLNLADVKRISIMMRSFFGAQQGPFHLEFEYILAYADRTPAYQAHGASNITTHVSTGQPPMEKQDEAAAVQSSWLGGLRGLFRW